MIDYSIECKYEKCLALVDFHSLTSDIIKHFDILDKAKTLGHIIILYIIAKQ